MLRRTPLLCLAGVACAGRPSPAPPETALAPDASVVVVIPANFADASAPAAAAPISSQELLRRGFGQWVFEGPQHTRVLYTWTTIEQLAALRRGDPVLQRSFSPTKGYATFDHALHERVTRGDARAKLLWHEGFAKNRFAWSNAFGAALGLHGESYGNVLLRITLKPEATFDAFLSHAKEIVSQTPDAPERLGAITFETPKYREYVLPNESMIERVEAFTPALRVDVEAQVAFLRGTLADEALAPPHVMPAFFPFRGALYGAAEVRAAIAALEAWLDMKDAPFERAVDAKFVLGPPRASIAALCKKLGIAKRVRSQNISFGPQSFYEPQCAPAGDMCAPMSMADAAKSVCITTPPFFR